MTIFRQHCSAALAPSWDAPSWDAVVAIGGGAPGVRERAPLPPSPEAGPPTDPGPA